MTMPSVAAETSVTSESPERCGGQSVGPSRTHTSLLSPASTSSPTIDEVSKAIRHTRSGKSPGMDGIPAEIFKSAVPVAFELINSIWEEEDVTKEFRNATFVSLFKNRVSKTDCGNYQGNSLLSIAGNNLARVFLNRLITNFSEENLPEAQCGFRPNRSTTDMIFSVRPAQEKCIDQNMNLIASS